jgi:hypothetical protein
MDYKFEDVDKIIGFSSWSLKQKLDELYRIDSDMYCNLGTDSTKKEKQDVKAKSRKIYSAIKKIDEKTGKTLLFAMDSK